MKESFLDEIVLLKSSKSTQSYFDVPTQGRLGKKPRKNENIDKQIERDKHN